ncbi:conserved hypothetical protein [Verticillium alfalfae VaMs.102]|uniref:Uncharacterized protein n=1 Tax=Verticillium alfalfae (strain VaMs.102 / ATCC MYA-4576 / FGSC 10136) TaxID=526221 RepID=C9SR35_VERA1|nr:conserved hypothetical protein [Verticillium alfalfae VaMs.102]EEY21310.1 conserved hypothetical protein [Verticillium alfalfae VaMs.102]
MAPVRRYLRITKYSVLECRIYLDNPALAASWLLHPRDPVLPRVMDAVRPLVLPKLREEQARARARKKTAKRRQIKDVAAGDGFEVSVFLTETPTRHALLAKQRRFRDKNAGDPARRDSAVQGRLIAETNAAPVDVDAFLGRRQQQQQQQQQQGTITIREESDDEDAVAALAEIPTRQDDGPPPARPAKRRRVFSPRASPDDDEFASTSDDEPGGERADENANESEHDDDNDDNDDDGLFVDDHPEEPETSPPSKRRKKQEQSPPEGAEKAVGGSRGGHDHEGDDGDDKKKMAMDVSFEGFAIHGRVLCLVVKRRDTHRAPASSGRSAASAASGAAAPAGQAIMENWISSTQMPNPGADVEAIDE